MLEGRIYGDPARWVESQHLIEQIDSVWVGWEDLAGAVVCLGELAVEVDFWLIWEVADVLLGARGTNALERLLIRRAKLLDDLVELVDIILTLEEWTSTKQLCQNTSYGPYID